MHQSEQIEVKLSPAEYKSRPTKASKEYTLNHVMRDTRELCDEDEKSLYVHQNHAMISKNGEALNSDGFVFCSGVLIHNLDTNEAYLAHVPNWDLNEKQYEEMKKLSNGNYKVVILAGKKSLFTKDSILDEKITDFVKRFTTSTGGRILFSDDIIVNSEGNGWSVSYKPIQRMFKVYTSHDQTVREYPL